MEKIGSERAYFVDEGEFPAPDEPSRLDPTVSGALSIPAVIAKIDAMYMFKREADAIKKTYEEAYAAYDARRKEIISLLEEYELDRLDGTECTVTVKKKSSVRVPQDLESKEAFFGYLRERGIFTEMVSVNSKTLNSWFNKEEEAAVARGEIEFKVPGLDMVTPYSDLSIRRK